jgi:hypothetical protein
MVAGLFRRTELKSENKSKMRVRSKVLLILKICLALPSGEFPSCTPDDTSVSRILQVEGSITC